MMQREKPEDYVIGTGETHTVREFAEEAFRLAGIPDWRRYVEIDPRYHRPTEVPILLADAKKAREQLGWEPKVKFKDLVKIMLAADCAREGVNPVTIRPEGGGFL